MVTFDEFLKDFNQKCTLALDICKDNTTLTYWERADRTITFYKRVKEIWFNTLAVRDNEIFRCYTDGFTWLSEELGKYFLDSNLATPLVFVQLNLTAMLQNISDRAKKVLLERFELQKIESDFKSDINTM